ncbi:hypothetical protein PHYSODRAFT_483273 [Phytophthora sojae]|uniref:WW domain-containing oxidoreductase n=1 Tax=Phytophthora sojae (strain P6497) TaxID=1094619 RepID=G4Z0E4_PHYSP|nr:hypothetical protein PHYSODRAFT_483273 [Phytophthora sojae]EGZ25230.1 hypothetical protein PHYSODRAFT_483273 [Phytophthora sojae]|eukprot:XP_009520518.1 hypothetical protein PHYSODRAFT_483273 [Phytophthora sojae]
MGAKASKSAASQPQVPSNWNAAQMPSQAGKVAIVTGANSGIGYEMALELARKGAEVVLACRNEERSLQAQADIVGQLAASADAGSVKFMQVDVGDLSSVRNFCEEFKKAYSRLDILINNAGIGGGTYTKTVDGYELVFATNYLGHFLLTTQLFYYLKKSAPARVVSVSSFLHCFVHRQAWLSFNENRVMAPNEKTYAQWSNYANTKLYNILFTMELHRRLRAKGITGVTAAACHPGIASTNLFTAPATDNRSCFWKIFFKASTVVPHQSTQMGALPTLYAATGDNVAGGDFFGPGNLGTFFGYPRREEPSKLSRSTKAAWKLWEASEKLAKVNFCFE